MQIICDYQTASNCNHGKGNIIIYYPHTWDSLEFTLQRVCFGHSLKPEL